ncbi:MAG: Trk system potassium transporter TrkA [Bacteroidales bacterium]|jgi:trk system potassium uptake protein TrkA|nr:Trk system potassium transporter TrkA [Bacteroidales bacterium]
MKIVIAGAGEVGTHLAKMLSNEEHDIVLLDDDPEKLQVISNQVDLLTVTGHANSFRDLKDAGIAKADLLIAVTPYEERNVMACIMAKESGALRTIARINNYEYLEEKHKETLRKLGVDELIYPENLAGKEIVYSLKEVATRQQIEFSGGKLVLMGVKIRSNAQIINKSLIEMAQFEPDMRIVAINRNNTTIIPHGRDVILEGDIVFFFTTRAWQVEMLELAGKEIFPVRNIMMVGGSRIAERTIKRLGDHYNIKLIEADKTRSEEIAGAFENVLVINGDGRNLELLKEERISQMDAFVAVTGDSETNILACHLAKRMGVKRTVARVENLDFMDIAESMDIGYVVNKKLIAASYIYKYTMGAEVARAKCLTASQAEVFEMVPKDGARITNTMLKDMQLPEDIIIGGITRNDKVMIAKGDTVILPGDRVVVFVLPSAIRKLNKYFT